MLLRVPHHSDCHKNAFPFNSDDEYLQYTHERVVDTIWTDEQYRKNAATAQMTVSDDTQEDRSMRHKIETLGRSRIELRIAEELPNCRLRLDYGVFRVRSFL